MWKSVCAAAISMWVSGEALAQPLQTTFTYQGELMSDGLPAGGPHDMRFRLYDAASGGGQIGPALCSDNLVVTDGKFVVALDFGAVFAGARRWLEIEVRADAGLGCGENSGFTSLSGRQELTAAPNAVFALDSQSLAGQTGAFYQNAANLTGTVADARLSSNIFRLSGSQTVSGATTFSSPSNTFAGSGAALTGLNAANISSGTLADTRLTPNVPLQDRVNTFTKNNYLSMPNLAGSLTGLFLLKDHTGSIAAPSSSDVVIADAGNTPTTTLIRIDGDASGRLYFGKFDTAAAAFDFGGQLAFGVNVPRGFEFITYPTPFSTTGFTRLAITANGGVGINKPDPADGTLDVDGPGVFRNTALAGRGVSGESLAPTGIGVLGLSSSTTGAARGVEGESRSTTGTGVRALNTAVTGNATALSGTTSSPTGYAAQLTGPAGSRTYVGTLLGVGELTPLTPLHVTAEDQSVPVAAMENDDLIVEATDATIGLYSGQSGNFGSSIAMKEMAAGALVNTWGITRLTTAGGNDLRFTFGTDKDYAANPTILALADTGGIGVGAAPTDARFLVRGDATIGRMVIDPGASNLNSEIGLYENTAHSLGAILRYTGATSNALQIVGVNSATTEVVLLEADRDANSGAGSVNVPVQFSAASKAFRIDHPLDPMNKELWHSCVESPDMKNIYDGVAITDESGYATITLPSYFEALNSDFRYQLTVIDEADAEDLLLWAKVVRKIGTVAPNQFTIRTARGGTEVSWQVTGIRKDAYANAHRIRPEVEKEPGDKGRLISPLPAAAPAASD